jgi:outer membrane immunogenic protein
MKLIKTSLLIASMGISSVSLANEMYFGGSFAATEYSATGLYEDASLTVFSGKMGTKFDDNFAAEARVGFGIDDGTVDVGINVKLKSFYGVYLKAGFPVSDTFYPYAVLGYTRSEIELSDKRFAFSTSESDSSFGLGADFNFESLTLNVEYLNYLDKGGAEVSGISIGFSKSF